MYLSVYIGTIDARCEVGRGRPVDGTRDKPDDTTGAPAHSSSFGSE